MVLATEGFQQVTKALGKQLSAFEPQGRTWLGKRKNLNQNRAKGTKGNLTQISFLACLSRVGSRAEPPCSPLPLPGFISTQVLSNGHGLEGSADAGL